MDRKFDLILKKLEDIEDRLKKLEISCDKMNNHVDFVESVYSKIKSPFHYLMDRASYLSGSRTITR